MNIQHQIKVWLCILAVAPSATAFQPAKIQKQVPAAKELDMTASIGNFFDSEDAEKTMEVVGKLGKGLSKTVKGTMSTISMAQETFEKSGAAEKTLKAVGDVSEGLSKSYEGTVTTISFAQETYKKDGTLATLPQRMAEKAIRDKAEKVKKDMKLQQQQMVNELKAKMGAKISQGKNEIKATLEAKLERGKSKVEQKLDLGLAELELLKDVPTHMVDDFKQTLESEEFKHEMKEAPGRAFSAISAFVNSDEVKAAKKLAQKAVKESLESEEVQALKKRASQAINESLENKK